MTLRNEEIARRWRNGEHGQNRSMYTDGRNLFSYRLLIGYTTSLGEKVVYLYAAWSGKGRFISMTTSQHVSIAVRYAEIVLNPDTYERVSL